MSSDHSNFMWKILPKKLYVENTEAGILIMFQHYLLFYQINMKGLDRIPGPIYAGTGCVFRRHALYGYDAQL
jgi:hypothetical protein